ncbi:hypothetical protein RND71_016841 [Anisodus tanguticus]|uniref:Uncharacterized protein n=1 Tax=Anisodus tanguticus TaxID=243964 RepID=A0AAE1VD72_9SOLA|nr:hypothetical protein RND71_016841 [Anisodus tanguticus]
MSLTSPKGHDQHDLDAGIRHLTTIPILEELWIPETGVATDGVVLLSSLTNLSLLDLGGLPVSDSALCNLKVLRKLQYLDLWGSEVSNKGASHLKWFPRLSSLNLSWTKVTKLPSLPSLACLNMSNCTIHSIFEGGQKALLTKLILSGAIIRDVSEAFVHLETSSLSILDLSNSSLNSYCFLPYMSAISDLDLSGTSAGNETVEHIACVGIVNEVDSDPNCVSSLSGLSSLGHLERSDLEKTRIKDSALAPLPSFRKLSYLFLRSGSLTDTTLHQLSSIRSLQRHPQIEVRHDLLSIALVKRLSVPSSLSQATPRTKLYTNKKGGSSTSPLRSNRDSFLDQRLKYTREELLAMSFGSASISRDNVDWIPHALTTDG